ncbi:MAG: NAD-dependent epimerase/dehydratase family protein [Gammaproteobacteria bacterium]|nr:NAD-dependent epimerase/dehydratase family protein [Gammaproteobacteria bacterium]
MTFTNAKILVVGGAGFVGSNLCNALLEHDPKEIIIVDNLLSSEISQVPDNTKITFILGSITKDAILESLPNDINYVFHLATYHGNQSSIHDPLADHENNTLTSLKLFDRIKSFTELNKVVYSSAGCTVAQKTFDEATATTEEDNVSLFLDSPYQISKIIGELYGNYYWHRYRLPFVKARFQNVYGPNEVLGAGQWRGTVHTVWRNVIPTFIFQALHHEALPVDNNGIATRDFIFIDDIVKGLISCALEGTPGEIYNLASGQETSILELAQSINNIVGNPTEIHFKSARDWDRSGKRYGDTEKAKSKINFKAEIDINQGLNKTIEWTLANLNIIKHSIAKHVHYTSGIKKYLEVT